MEEKINVVEILKDKSTRTKLYSPLYGEVFLSRLVGNNGIRVLCKGLDGSLGTDEKSFWKNGKFTLGGEICLFPSKEMRDWEKFAWKKGDVLSCGFNNLCIFEKWANIEYTEFEAKFATPNYRSAVLKTEYWSKTTTESLIKQHISKIEEIKGGKLNISTLEIEKQHEFKDGDILFTEDLLNGYIYIYKEPSRGIDICYCYKITAGCLYICNLENRYDCVLPSNTIKEYKTRFATDSEKYQLFDALAEEGKAWDSDKKQIVDLPKKCEFKPFDKVLVRDTEKEYWIPAFFASFDEHSINGYAYRLVGDPDGVYYKYCIPYNESTKHLLGTTDKWKGGEG
jgi:hypothetical protein